MALKKDLSLYQEIFSELEGEVEKLGNEASLAAKYQRSHRLAKA